MNKEKVKKIFISILFLEKLRKKSLEDETMW